MSTPTTTSTPPRPRPAADARPPEGSRARLWAKVLAPVVAGVGLVGFLAWGNSRSWVFDRDRTSGGVDACTLLSRDEAEAILGLRLAFEPRHGSSTVGGAVIGSEQDGSRLEPTVERRDVEVTERSRCSYIAIVPGESAVPVRALLLSAYVGDPAAAAARYDQVVRDLPLAAVAGGQNVPATADQPGVGARAQLARWSNQLHTTSLLAVDGAAMVTIDSVGVDDAALADAARAVLATAATLPRAS